MRLVKSPIPARDRNRVQSAWKACGIRVVLIVIGDSSEYYVMFVKHLIDLFIVQSLVATVTLVPCSPSSMFPNPYRPSAGYAELIFPQLISLSKKEVAGVQFLISQELP